MSASHQLTLTTDLSMHCCAGRPIAKAPTTYKDAHETEADI
jgi:hypothetical protein